MKSLPGSQPLLGGIPPELVAGILGMSYDASLSVSVSSPLFAYGSLILFVSFLSSSPVLLYCPFDLFFYPSLFFFSFFIALCFISCFAHSLPLLFPAQLCFSLLRSHLSVFFSSVSPFWVLLLLLLSLFLFFIHLLPLFLTSPSAFILPLLHVFLSFSRTVFFFCFLLALSPLFSLFLLLL